MPFWTQKKSSNTGGVTSIIAGTNITISPSGGTGDVTINASGFQLPTGSVNGVNQVFVFAKAPNAIAVDGQPLQKVDQLGNIYWTGTTTVTLTFAPNQSVFGIA